jgi:ubiquitin C-terminal hydrolase
MYKEKPIYELLGVVCHSGTLTKGHYYSYARNKVVIDIK